MLEALKALPALARKAVERAQELTPGVAPDQVAPARASTAAPQRRRELLLIASACLLGGIIWLGLRVEPPWLGALLAVAGLGGTAAIAAGPLGVNRP